MEIQIVGPGCPRCQAAERNVIRACKELGLDLPIKHIYDIQEIIQLGVRTTPAVLIDGKIVSAGKIPSVGDIKNILSQMVQGKAS